ncbi:FAD-dependent oxidoreductase [Adhaeretor mobilis]|uniref:Dihydropyrimidine dehydrogenase subunit A n=1 Tax=Adhaeretor mobilis TaxID=1930276 RepID=A0A517MYS2_9BACT|nr:FAD-dependent oxidoreductase [Adhaeretor mobilis]QDS99993.1 dihydropyrimidine dehydrogenase subunit A [Adhaeretor mobilis]
MHVEPPATIAIIGAGPIGLEVALYARYLGYKVTIFERGGSPAANVREWGHVRLFTPFGMNASPLGVAALEAQDPEFQSPSAQEVLTGNELCDSYLDLLAASDLLIDSIRLDTRVISIGRPNYRKGQGTGKPERAEHGFRLLVENRAGNDGEHNEEFFAADIVIDCSGTFGNACAIGQGGVLAKGERQTRERIEFGLPDLLGAQRQQYAGKHTLVIGAGYSAATNVTLLADLAEGDPSTQVTWLTLASNQELPISRIPDDTLIKRDSLAQQANHFASSPGPVTWKTTAGITAVTYREQSSDFEIQLAEEEPPIIVDNIIANVGCQPDSSFFRELQVHQCYSSEGPMKLASALLSDKSESDDSTDCLTQVSHGGESLLTSEPNFYILGAKSYGRGSNFLLRTGLEQIRDLFTLIRGREDLDLYATMPAIRT